MLFQHKIEAYKYTICQSYDFLQKSYLILDELSDFKDDEQEWVDNKMPELFRQLNPLIDKMDLEFLSHIIFLPEKFINAYNTFSYASHYNQDKVNKNVAEVLANSFQSASEKTILYEVEMIKALRPNLKKFFYHTSINFPPSEDFNNKTMRQIGLDYLKESGFTQHQFLMFRHHDADHPHLHILVNRIGYDGKVGIVTGWSYSREFYPR